MTEAVFFPAPWDHKLRVLTFVFSSILLGSTAVTILISSRVAVTPNARAVLLAGGAISLLALGLAAALGPRGYTVDNESIRVERWLRPLAIPLRAIESVESLPGERLQVSIRTLGSGGLFGYYGRFRNAALGSYRMYATRSRGYVLIRSDVPYVLTPESPERFIALVDEQRSHLARR